MNKEDKIEAYSEFIYDALTHSQGLEPKDMLRILDETRILIKVQLENSDQK